MLPRADWRLLTRQVRQHAARLLDGSKNLLVRFASRQPLLQQRTLPPIFLTQRPEQLSGAPVLFPECARQRRFGARAKFLQGRLPTGIALGRARFDPVHLERRKGEFRDEARSFDKDARRPEWRANGKAPLGHEERRLEGTKLNDPYGLLQAVRHDTEAETLSGGALAVRPAYESREGIHRPWRSRDVFGDCRVREKFKQRPCVGRDDFAHGNQRT